MTPEELDQAILEARELVDNNRNRLEQAKAVFRSTPDGMGEAMRDAELSAATHGPTSRQVRRRYREIINAERAAADEYQARAARWGHRDGDGPLYALLLGNTPWAAIARNAGLVGTYRVAPEEHEETTVTVALYNRETRARARLSHPRPTAGRLTVDEILAAAAANPLMHERISRVLNQPFPPRDGRTIGQL